MCYSLNLGRGAGWPGRAQVECESALSAARFLNLTIGTNREPVAVVEPVLLADAFGRLAPAPDGVSATARFDSATGELRFLFGPMRLSGSWCV